MSGVDRSVEGGGWRLRAVLAKLGSFGKGRLAPGRSDVVTPHSSQGMDVGPVWGIVEKGDPTLEDRHAEDKVKILIPFN